MSQATPNKLMITGAGGFVGPHLINQALKSDLGFERILACTKDESEMGEDSACGKVTWKSFDILSSVETLALVEEFAPTHVIHLAAISHVPTAMANPNLVWTVNIMGTLNLLETLKKAASAATVLFVSSSEVYGRSFQSGDPLTEEAQLQPRNPYAATKAAGEQMLVQYAETDMKIIRARPFNHIGPGQTEAFVISAFGSQIARIEAGKQEPVLKVGNLDAQRDFLDVSDVVRAYIKLLEAAPNLASGGVYNVSSGTARSIKSILHELKALSSAEFEIETDPSRMRASDTPSALGNSDKLKAETGWAPKIAWTDTLKSILDDWRNKA